MEFLADSFLSILFFNEKPPLNSHVLVLVSNCVATSREARKNGNPPSSRGVCSTDGDNKSPSAGFHGTPSNNPVAKPSRWCHHSSPVLFLTVVVGGRPGVASATRGPSQNAPLFPPRASQTLGRKSSIIDCPLPPNLKAGELTAIDQPLGLRAAVRALACMR